MSSRYMSLPGELPAVFFTNVTPLLARAAANELSGREEGRPLWEAPFEDEPNFLAVVWECFELAAKALRIHIVNC
jgi:hypothetical protein